MLLSDNVSIVFVISIMYSIFLYRPVHDGQLEHHVVIPRHLVDGLLVAVTRSVNACFLGFPHPRPQVGEDKAHHHHPQGEDARAADNQSCKSIYFILKIILF